MYKRDFIIDIQAFHDKNGKYLPKEVAVLALDCNFLAHWIIKPPYPSSDLQKPFLITNSFLSCHHHGIEWFDGESHLEDVYKVLREVARSAVRIYVRGLEKQELMEHVLSRQVINLEEYNCPSIKSLPRTDEHSCFYHAQRTEYFSCALSYVYKLRYWILKSLEVVETNTSSRDVTDLCKKQIREITEKVKSLNRNLSINPPPEKSAAPATESDSDGFSTAATCTTPLAGSDSGSLSCRQTTCCLGKTVCNSH